MLERVGTKRRYRIVDIFPGSVTLFKDRNSGKRMLHIDGSKKGVGQVYFEIFEDGSRPSQVASAFQEFNTLADESKPTEKSVSLDKSTTSSVV